MWRQHNSSKAHSQRMLQGGPEGAVWTPVCCTGDAPVSGKSEDDKRQRGGTAYHQTLLLYKGGASSHRLWTRKKQACSSTLDQASTKLSGQGRRGLVTFTTRDAGQLHVQHMHYPSSTTTCITSRNSPECDGTTPQSCTSHQACSTTAVAHATQQLCQQQAIRLLLVHQHHIQQQQKQQQKPLAAQLLLPHSATRHGIHKLVPTYYIYCYQHHRPHLHTASQTPPN
jgi:hypothetical protein